MGANWPETKETPNMDRLAQQGMRFTDMHSMSVCTPSRAALLTGRLGLRTGVVSNFAVDSLYGLPLTEITIAELLKSANYSTGAVGKWHLGHSRAFHPSSRGFDFYVGIPYSVDMGCVNCPNENLPEETPCPYDPHPQITEPAVPLYNTTTANCSAHDTCNADIIEQPVDLQTLASIYASTARRFILKHAPGQPLAHNPFLLYVPFSHIHVPLSHDPKFTHRSARNTTFGDTLLELDDTIGKVLVALEEAKVADNTIVFLMGDNGPWRVKCDLAGSPGPFVGTYQKKLGGGSTEKMTTWEGGHRVVGVAAWPGHIPAGATSGATVSTMDLLPTLAALAGTPLPKGRHFDGVDISSVLFDGASVVPGRDFLFHPGCYNNYSGLLEAARYGRFKAHFASYSVAGCKESGTDRIEHNPPLIFDLDMDPGESTPLVNPPKELLSAFTKALEEKMKDIKSSFRSIANYTQGGVDAWPCCNSKNVGCRCKG